MGDLKDEYEFNSGDQHSVQRKQDGQRAQPFDLALFSSSI